MLAWLRSPVFAVFLAVTGVSCQGPREEEADTSARPPTAPSVPANLPLKETMRGLESDLADLAHGIWIEDREAAGAAAMRIANHPRVPPEQLAAIQASHDEFPAFVQLDLGMHNSAVALAEASASSVPTEELFAAYLQIQQGCMSCHTVYRTRVSDALGDPGGAGG